MRPMVALNLRGVVLTGMLLFGASLPAAAQNPPRQDVSFEVTNLNDGATHTLFGFTQAPACEADTAVVLLHGLSYTSESWDMPGLSYAQFLADRGYAVVAVDRLGYGRSVLDDGYNVSTIAHADMAAQVATQLTAAYDKVVLAGHSAGGETVTTATSVFEAPVDALVVMGYTTYPDPDFLVNDWIMGDQMRALTQDYEYFMGTPERRAEMFYTEHADQSVIDADTATAVLTPSGEIQTISFQPSRIGSALVDVPTLLQLAEEDQLFPIDFADQWQAQFVSAPSVTLDTIPRSGHTYMLHHEGPAAAQRLADWLEGSAGLPGCVAAAAAPPPAPANEPAPPPAEPEPLPATGGGLGLVGRLAALGVLIVGGVRSGTSRF